MNAYDASAVEEALVLRDKYGGSVDVVSVGPERASETLRKALAMGADDAFHIVTSESPELDSRAFADILASFFRAHPYDVVSCGKQSQDSDAGLTGPMVAELLGLCFVGNAVGLDVHDGVLRVTRQGDAGQEVMDLAAPCLVTCSNDMNDPRIPALKGIMAAKRKTIHVLHPADLGAADPVVRTEVTALEPVRDRPPGAMLDGEPADMAGDLVSRLRNEVRVL